MTQEFHTRIMRVVDERFEEQIAFAAELSACPSTRGKEQAAQRLVARAFHRIFRSRD